MTIVPEKRPSSPPAPTAATLASSSTIVQDADSDVLPSPAKVRKLNDYGEDASPAKAELGPKKPRKAINMNSVWVNFLDNIFEEEDFEESLLALEGFAGPHHLVRRSHMRQLLALSLNPSACASYSDVKPRFKAPSETSDPFDVTERKIRLATLRLIQGIASTSGAAAVFRAIPHAGEDEALMSEEQRAEHTARTARYIAEDRDDAASDPADSLFQFAGKRVLQNCRDVWALLGGAAMKKKPPMTPEQPVVAHGWELLRVFVGIWEAEQDERRMKGELPVAPTLIWSLQHHNTSGVRMMSSKPLEIILWPFQYAEALAEEDAENSEPEDEDVAAARADEASLYEKRMTAVRLLALFGNAAQSGRLLLNSLLSETVPRLKMLKPTELNLLLQMLMPHNPALVATLAYQYIEIYSQHPPAASGSTSHPLSPMPASPRRSAMQNQSSSSSLLSQQPPQSSPSRRRTLSVQGSQSSLSGGVTGTGAMPPLLPSISAHDVRKTLALLPLELPTSQQPTAASAAIASLSTPLQKRRGKNFSGDNKVSLDSVKNACEAHRFVKDIWLEVVLGESVEDVNGSAEARSDNVAQRRKLADEVLTKKDGQQSVVEKELQSVEQVVQRALAGLQ